MVNKMDFNYFKYCLKNFFISDFKRTEIADILNAAEPEKFSRLYLKTLNFKEENENRMRIKFRMLIEKAYAANVPLGGELGNYPTPEDAYLARQQYISKYLRLSEAISSFNKFLFALILALIAVSVVLLFI